MTKIYFDDYIQKSQWEAHLKLQQSFEQILTPLLDDITTSLEGLQKVVDDFTDTIRAFKDNEDRLRHEYLSKLIDQQPDPDAARSAVEHECRGATAEERISIETAWIEFWENN